VSAALPAWLEPLMAAEEMRSTDAWAIAECGIPGGELMERAGAAVARAAAARAPSGPIVVVAGKGNNGGDGLVAARLLRGEGRGVEVLAVGDLAESRGDARANLDALPGDPPEPFAPGRLAGAALVLDAVLGTGFAGNAREPARGAIEAMSEAAAPVLAVDVPSGVDATTGEVADVAVRAQATVTFHAAKPGLWIHPGKAHAGAVEVVDIGIPAGGPASPRAGLIDDAIRDAIPRRAADGTKFASGAVLVCGGSTGLTGAPCLAAEAAMRAGAGYVTACVPGSLQSIFEVRLLEVMTVGLADDDGALGPEGVDTVLQRAERADALVLGPGLGRAEATAAFGRALAAGATIPLLLDADGLNVHAGELGRLAGRDAATVLTPHAGELGRLLDRPSDAVQAHRLAGAREAAERSRAVVVLKGDDTLVARPDGVVAVSRGGSPGLATAGTGDVLSGVTGAILAKRLDAWTAACAAVWLHARAGRLAAEARHGPDGVIASDVIEALPRALA
jgi:ADP-dependent NAD(P)H-hydrate dehydratase / NAD(P)H-hydrate epimerase